MVLDLSKWLKETSLYGKKNNYKKYELLHKRKVHIKKKERVYEFFGLRKSWYYGFLGVKGYFFKRGKLVENNDKIIFSLVWNTMFTGY